MPELALKTGGVGEAESLLGVRPDELETAKVHAHFPGTDVVADDLGER